jgi:hypothetical protein
MEGTLSQSCTCPFYSYLTSLLLDFEYYVHRAAVAAQANGLPETYWRTRPYKERSELTNQEKYAAQEAELWASIVRLQNILEHSQWITAAQRRDCSLLRT